MNTTVDGRNPAPTGMYNDYPVNNGIFTIISTGAEFLPSTVRIQAFFIGMDPSN